jgi:hypothetical protein
VGFAIEFPTFPMEFPSGGIIGNYARTFKIPHKCSHTTGINSFHFEVGHGKGLGLDG